MILRELAARLGCELRGDGDVEITGMSSALELDSGVGDVAVSQRAGSIALDLGVGTAVVRAPAAEMKSAAVGYQPTSVVNRRAQAMEVRRQRWATSAHYGHSFGGLGRCLATHITTGG